MIFFYLIIIIGIATAGFGVYMIYSSITGKGIPHPGEHSHLSIKLQYRIRGFTGLALLAVSALILTMVFSI
jgi:hypothetical protein